MRAAGYVRVSTEEQAREGVSLDAQTAKIEAYCLLNGLELVTLYRDEGVSAGKPLSERPQGRELLAAVASGEVVHVVALKLDRLFRDAVDTLNTSRAWDTAGVAMHLLDLGGQAVNTASAMGRFFLTIMAGAAEMERNLVRERTRMAMAHMRARGDRLGATPLGFVTIEPRSPMQPVSAEMEPVRLILARRGAGDTFRSIAAQLRDAGLATKRGGKWDATTVRNVWERRARYESVLTHESPLA